MAQETRKSRSREAMTPQMDWMQVALLDGAAPCFFIEGPEYCGRAMSYPGHGNPAFHEYISLDAALTTVRDEAYEAAGRLVCGYCDGHFTSWEREARRGALGSGNWIHREKGDAARHVLCAATGIYNKVEFSRAFKSPQGSERL